MLSVEWQNKIDKQLGRMKMKILLVDDKPENLYSLECILQDDSIELLKALSGEAALKMAFEEDINLVLLDVQMPEMDGYEVARMLKSTRRTKNIPIIFVTAISKEKEYIVRGLNEGAVDYLFKPLDPEITKAKVNTLLQIQRQQMEIERMNAEMIHLNKEKSMFLEMAAHDLRNPIGNILNIGFLLQSEMGDQIPSDHKTMLEMMVQSCQGMIDLLNNILNISKIESGNVLENVQHYHIQDLLEDCISSNKIIADNKRIFLSYCMKEDVAMVATDRLLFKQVLSNLISNAIKYSHSGTAIEVIAENGNDEVCVHVKDQGLGIPETEQEKLFKAFGRTSVTGTAGEQSTGLGLSIVKKLVEKGNGRIWFNSKKGEGSTFSFSMPGVKVPGSNEKVDCN